MTISSRDLQHSQEETKALPDKLSKILGLFPPAKDVINPLSDSKEAEIPYTIVYIFQGNLFTGFVGHATFWDGKNYYSFYPTKKLDGVWFYEALSDSPAHPEAAADQRANNQISNCGVWTKIILPMSPDFNRNAVEEKISGNWRTSQYNLLFHNCVHQVMNQLIEAKIVDKEEANAIPFHTPSVLENFCREIGKKRFGLHLAAERKSSDAGAKLENRRNYLLLLGKELSEPNTPADIQTQLLSFFDKKNLVEMKAEDVHTLYFSIKKWLAAKHYDIPDQGTEFYAKWLALSLVPNCMAQKNPAFEIENYSLLAEQKKMAGTSIDARYNMLLSSMKMLTTTLYDHFKIAEGGNIEKDVAEIIKAFKGKRCLKPFFRALLNVILSKIPDAAFKHSREEFLSGEKPLLYLYFKNEIHAVINQLQNPGWRAREASLFGRGIIEIMQYAIKYSEFLLLDKIDDYKNLIESMRNIARIDLVINPRNNFLLPLKQVIDKHERFAAVKSSLQDYSVTSFICQDFITRMTMASAPRDYLNTIIFSFVDGANPEVIAKKILVDLADRGSKVFGEGEKAEEFYKSFIEMLQDIDDLTVEACTESARTLSPR